MIFFLTNNYNMCIQLKVMILLSVIFLGIFNCKKDNNNITNPKVSDAKYVLPYPVGEKYLCSQSFGGNISHQGVFYYSVDFNMPKESIITAARKGSVIFFQENFYDYDIGTEKSNVVIIQHEDSTYARYAHLTHNGALVELGQVVIPGDTLGLCGKSGAISYHLHFDVTEDCPQTNCQTIPFKFKNCSPVHYPLKNGVYYIAE
ncbi:M23 family metallopeptidase [candidate division WOR-3 bacterium]|nr:M23 family metallopeptidase [candidate division WOR-3 bacterium]